jgi:hypothetical protein
MREPPRFPFDQMAALLAVAADLGFILLLWFSSIPIAVKVLTTALLCAIAIAIVAFFLGRWYQSKK